MQQEHFEAVIDDLDYIGGGNGIVAVLLGDGEPPEETVAQLDPSVLHLSDELKPAWIEIEGYCLRLEIV
ncbi:hypothetical protein GCM10009692_14850 [Leucobacter aridicollis]